jgi:hypothetical protein
MERTKSNAPKSEEEKKLRMFRKIGGGSFQLGNRIIKPGQTFEANPDDIPMAHRDVVIPVDGDMVTWKDKNKQETVLTGLEEKVVKPEYLLQPHGKSLFLFDVVTDTGKKDGEGNPIYKILNEKSLKKEVAEKLIEDLKR